MSDATARTTVDIRQIAQIAKVGRSAVGNWRKRHADFPLPDSSGRFDLDEVERWLIENGKIDSSVPAEFALWSQIDSLRSYGLPAGEITDLLVSALVYLEACDASHDLSSQQVTEVTVNEGYQWTQLRQHQEVELGDELSRAARAIEQANPMLEGLLVGGLSVASSLPNDQLVSLLDGFQATTEDATPRVSLFNRVLQRATTLDRFRGKHSTPADIRKLMVQLAGRGAKTVCDPACGEGGLLSTAALRFQRSGSQAFKLVGYEIDERSLRIARSRLFLQGVEADLYEIDTFQVPQESLPKADVVLLDTPLGQKDWGNADIYKDDRWSFGLPPRFSADLAWMQLAVQCLSDSGVAVVGTSSRTAHQGGSVARIRQSLLESGVIRAVIQLPGRLRTEISDPLALWILQSPRSDARTVLLVDSSSLGTSRRSQHSLDEDAIARIVHALRTFEAGAVDDDEIAHAVSVDEIIDNDAILEPKRYQPIPKVDVEGARRRSQELREKLPDALEDATAALNLLLLSNGKTGHKAAPSTCALKEVTEIQRGSIRGELDDAESGIRLIGLPELTTDGASAHRFVDKKSSQEKFVEVQANDVIVALRGRTGSSMLVSEAHRGAVLDHSCALIRPKGSDITGPWVYLWTQSRQFRDQVSRATTGGMMPTISFRELPKLNIPMPTAEQLHAAEQLLSRFGDALDMFVRVQSDLAELQELEVEILLAHDAGIE